MGIVNDKKNSKGNSQCSWFHKQNNGIRPSSAPGAVMSWGTFSKGFQKVGTLLESLDQAAAKSVEKYRTNPDGSPMDEPESQPNKITNPTDDELIQTLNDLLDKPIKGSRGSSNGHTSGPKSLNKHGNLDGDIADIFASMSNEPRPPKVTATKIASQANGTASTPTSSAPSSSKMKSNPAKDHQQGKHSTPVKAETKISPEAVISSIHESARTDSTPSENQYLHNLSTTPVDEDAEKRELFIESSENIENQTKESAQSNTDEIEEEPEPEIGSQITLETDENHAQPQAKSRGFQVGSNVDAVNTQNAENTQREKDSNSDGKLAEEHSALKEESVKIETVNPQREIHQQVSTVPSETKADDLPKTKDTTHSSVDMHELNALREKNDILTHHLHAATKELESKSSKFKQTQAEIVALSKELESARKTITEKDALLNQKLSVDKEREQTISSKDAQIATLQLKMKQAIEEIKITKGVIDSFEEERQLIEMKHVKEREELQRTIEMHRQSEVKMKSELEHERQEHQNSKLRLAERERHLENELVQINLSIGQYQRLLDEKSIEIMKQETVCSNLSQEVKKAKQELQDYKLKATKALQAKDRELERVLAQTTGEPSVSPSPRGDATLSLLTQIEELRGQLQTSQASVAELTVSVKDLETVAAQVEELKMQCAGLEAELNTEKARNEALNHDLQDSHEELKRLHDEYSRLKASNTQTVLSHTQETQKLKKQIESLQSAEKMESVRELEGRLKSTTELLISRQTQIQQLQSEKTSLQLQLESEKRKRDMDNSDIEHRVAIPIRNESHNGESQPRSRSIVYFSDVSQDASPLSKNLAQAAQVLDRAGIQIGYFLRRYPVYRVAILCYFSILHLWVFFVLSSSSPLPDAGPNHPGSM